MRAGRLIAAGGAVLATVAFLPVAGQAPVPEGSGQSITISSADALALGPIVREIDDPHTGNRWLLFSDPAHPGGPGRIVVAPGKAEGTAVAAASPAARRLDQEIASLRPILHAGDRIVVEEHSAVVEARLAAVAQGPAGKGGFLNARLQIGGRVVRVVAVAPGLAEIASESEVQP